jgi:hypothetical protein
MNTSKLCAVSAVAIALSLSFGYAGAQSTSGNVNEAGVKTTPGSGTPSQSNAADKPNAAGSARTSNTTRKESTAAAKGSINVNEASTDNTADKPKAPSRTTLINRDKDGKFVPRAKSNGSKTVRENNEAGTK